MLVWMGKASCRLSPTRPIFGFPILPSLALSAGQTRLTLGLRIRVGDPPPKINLAPLAPALAAQAAVHDEHSPLMNC